MHLSWPILGIPSFLTVWWWRWKHISFLHVFPQQWFSINIKQGELNIYTSILFICSDGVLLHLIRGFTGFILRYWVPKTDPMWPWKLLQKSVGSPDMMILVGNNPYKMNVGHFRFLSCRRTYTPPETNSEFTPDNEGLEDDPFLLGWLPGRCYVRFREGKLW